MYIHMYSSIGYQQVKGILICWILGHFLLSIYFFIFVDLGKEILLLLL